MLHYSGDIMVDVTVVQLPQLLIFFHLFSNIYIVYIHRFEAVRFMFEFPLICRR